MPKTQIVDRNILCADLPRAVSDMQLAVRKFIEKEVISKIITYENTNIFPLEIFKKIGSKGFFKAHVDTKYGGDGLGTLGFCHVVEELSKAGFGVAKINHFQVLEMIIRYGSEKHKRKYLNRMLTGEILGAIAITEPEVGSSFAKMQTHAKKIKDKYIINGKKSLINDAAEADVLIVLAKGENGINVFAVDKGTPGYKIIKKQDPIGMRSSPIYEIEFRGCMVDKDMLLGEAGKGLASFFSVFNFSRIGNASAALGMAQSSFDKTISYLKKRKVGDAQVIEFQGIRWKIAEMSAKIEAARLLRNRAALSDKMNLDFALEASRTKLFCVNVANEVIGECIQITGRFGCLQDNLLGVYLRDAKTLGTAGGSLEVMRNNIASKVLGKK